MNEWIVVFQCLDALIAINVPLVSIQSAHTMLLYDTMNLDGLSLQQ